LSDQRFATAADRAKNARELIARLDEIFATKPLTEWAEIFGAEPEFFWAPVQTVEDLLADAQFAASGGLVEVPDEQSTMTMLATPADFGDQPAAPRFRAPRLGEHTETILAEAGYSNDQIDRLLAEGAVRVELSPEGSDPL
jgi:crotonobetainyl-CoA:carnitine CoA-transferase CaiB-like acyl-CoA transferase